MIIIYIRIVSNTCWQIYRLNSQLPIDRQRLNLENYEDKDKKFILIHLFFHSLSLPLPTNILNQIAVNRVGIMLWWQWKWLTICFSSINFDLGSNNCTDWFLVKYKTPFIVITYVYACCWTLLNLLILISFKILDWIALDN